MYMLVVFGSKAPVNFDINVFGIVEHTCQLFIKGLISLSFVVNESLQDVHIFSGGKVMSVRKYQLGKVPVSKDDKSIRNDFKNY